MVNFDRCIFKISQKWVFCRRSKRNKNDINIVQYSIRISRGVYVTLNIRYRKLIQALFVILASELKRVLGRSHASSRASYQPTSAIPIRVLYILNSSEDFDDEREYCM